MAKATHKNGAATTPVPPPIPDSVSVDLALADCRSAMTLVETTMAAIRETPTTAERRLDDLWGALTLSVEQLRSEIDDLTGHLAPERFPDVGSAA